MSKKIIKIIAISTVVLLSSCNGKSKQESVENNAINKVFLQNVKTEKAVLSNRQQELILNGKVECDPDRVVNYTPLISGVVERTFFSLGDRVVKGQKMLHIRSSELSLLQSELTIARRNLQSAEAMYEERLIPEKELIEARANYERLQSDLSLYGENIGGGIFAIKAPMTGYVVAKNASLGSTVSEGSEPIFTIADLSIVWIMVNVYAGNLQLVKEDLPVEITSLAYPDEIFSGKINAVSKVFDPEEKVMKARIVLSNKDLKFMPEMSVVVKLKNETHKNCLSILTDALIFDDNRYFVVVETAPEKFEIKEVQLQGHYQKNSYIHSGLNENDKVVVKNQLLIYAGLKEK